MESNQLYFNFENKKSYDDIIVGDFNKEAINFLFHNNKWLSNITIVYGDLGVGKSLLCNHFINALKGESILLDNIIIKQNNLSKNCYLVEDIQNINKHQEIELFHLINLINSSNKKLLITSNIPIIDINIQLPDLKSRLLGSNIINIKEPDEQDIKKIFVKILTHKQLNINLDVINYILFRLPRKMSYICEISNLLEHYVMVEKKTITIPFVKNKLNLH